MLAEAKHAAKCEGARAETRKTRRAPSVEFPSQCVRAVQSTADCLDYSSMRLVSGAGHDATHLASVTDISMVFAVSEKGKSHSPSEYTSWDDCYKLANTLFNATLDIAVK
ncbi:M20/M25/M40 family metallo-hydrolase [Natronorarus salvus]|uniref:M20/M25/M40 family metallo-hydrolase n=1 Tax=Natronorarus salvus TaxID=3117733 RepID=UPI002F26BDF3